MLTASGRKTFRILQPAWVQLNGPSAEPMSLVEAKEQCRRPLDDHTEDRLLQRMIEGARDQVERDSLRAICWQRWKLILDEWPDIIEIHKCPVIAIESITYKDFTTPTAVTVTVDPTTYRVNLTEPCRISPAFTKYWLPARPELGPIEITFTCGYLIPFTVSSSTLSFIDYTPTSGDSFRLTNSGGQLPVGLSERVTYYIINASGNTCQLSLTSNGSAVTLTNVGNGLNFLGEVPQSGMTAMRKWLAKEFADREGSESSGRCLDSYLQSLDSIKYSVL